LEGYNSSILRYGQTENENSFTIYEGRGACQCGIAVRAMDDILDSRTVADQVEVSYVQLHNDVVYDLLAPAATSRKWSILRKLEKPRAHKFEGETANFKHVKVANISAFLQLLKSVQASQNAVASYAHASVSSTCAILTITLKRRCKLDSVLESTAKDPAQSGSRQTLVQEQQRDSMLCIVDLARAEQTSTGTSNIKSLAEFHALEKCLKAKADNLCPPGGISDFVLTRLLAPSFDNSSYISLMISIGTSVFDEPETLQALQLGQHGMQVVSKRSQSLRPIREEGEILESNVNESVHHPMEPQGDLAGEVSGSSTFQHGQNIGEVDDMSKFLVELENNTGDESEKLKREMEGLRIKLEKSKKKHKSCKVQLKELQKQLQEAHEEATWYMNCLEVEKQGNKEIISQASQQMLEETVDISKENLVETKFKGVEEHVACLTLSRAIEKEEYKKSLEQVRKDLAEEMSKRKQVEELISDYATVLRQINGRQALVGSSSAKQIEELELENLKLQRMLTEKTQGIHVKEELQNIQPQGGMHHTSRSSEEIDPDNSQVTNSELDSEYIN